MIDAQRIALLRQEFGYHSDVAFATAEAGGYCYRLHEFEALPSEPADSPPAPAHPAEETSRGGSVTLIRRALVSAE